MRYIRLYLKNARERLGLTQQEMAESIGISQNYYCDIENGIRQKELKAGILSKLSNILNISVSEILEEEEKLKS